MKFELKLIKWFCFNYLGYKTSSNLHLVRIYFATPTFDRITKDERANFETKISAIGGTMGLLTGFSIISGVEIVYFAVKIILSLIKKSLQPSTRVAHISRLEKQLQNYESSYKTMMDWRWGLLCFLDVLLFS